MLSRLKSGAADEVETADNMVSNNFVILHDGSDCGK